MTGIDIPISRLVNLFETKLWNSVLNKEFNGRIYRNDKRGIVIPEKHIEGTNEYREILFNDKLNALCFFDASGTITNLSDQPNQEVRIVFALNLKNIYPDLSYRATEEAHKDVLDVINKGLIRGYSIDSIDTGLNAYGDLDTSKLKHYSMHPFYTFAVIVNIPFSYQCQL